jgi:hypothetical protein
MKRLGILRMQWHTVAFAVCLAASIGLIVGGFFVPPTGVIDGSVLTAVGLLFGYATLGQVHSLVSRGKKVTLNHGSTSISVGGRGWMQGASENGCGEPDGSGLPDGGEEDLDPC